MKRFGTFKKVILLIVISFTQLAFPINAAVRFLDNDSDCVCGGICPSGTTCREINDMYSNGESVGQKAKKTLIQICGCVSDIESNAVNDKTDEKNIEENDIDTTDNQGV